MQINFKEASLQQLQQIIRFEECPIIYKCFAESELKRRLERCGLAYPT